MTQDGHYEATSTHAPGRAGQRGDRRRAGHRDSAAMSTRGAAPASHSSWTRVEFSVNPKFLGEPRVVQEQELRPFARTPSPLKDSSADHTTNDKQQEEPWW